MLFTKYGLNLFNEIENCDMIASVLPFGTVNVIVSWDCNKSGVRFNNAVVVLGGLGGVEVVAPCGE